ncbi:Rhomboid- protein 3 [Tritrichomonas musculus]|uniref:Rhomboid- protein 3 n=1 Tax=Tritrichomonas musculus TaxID=1915356 RepID=A0ABR2HDA4_9EUKA
MDEISSEQIDQLMLVFQKFDQSNDGCLDEDELRNLLSDFEIDGNFAPVMLRIFSRANRSAEEQINELDGISFDNFLSFFVIMLSGNKKEFINLIFSAIDCDRDGKVGVNELIEFSRLIGDNLSIDEAKAMIADCLEKQKSEHAIVYNDSLNEENFSKFKINENSENRQFDFDQLWIRCT